MLDQKVFAAIAQYLKKYIANPVVIQAESQGKRIIAGRFKSGASVFDFELTPKGVSYKPTQIASRNDALFGQSIGQYKCTAGKSYQCGKICLTVHNRCKKNENNEADIRRLASIFAYANSKEANQSKAKTLTKKAISAVQAGMEERVVRLANKVNQQDQRKQLAKQKKEGRKAKTEVPENHVVSGNPRYTSQAITEAFNAINSEGAKERINGLAGLIQKQGLQAVFNDGTIDKKDLADKVDFHPQNILKVKNAIAEHKKLANKYESEGKPEVAKMIRSKVAEAEQKIGDNFVQVDKNVNGFTAASINHVVIMAKPSNKPFSVKPEDISRALDVVYDSVGKDLPDWSVSNSLRKNNVSSDGASFITYLHEIGHQVDFLARHASGEKTKTSDKNATKYSKSNDNEWFAEHFALWFLDAKRYQKFDPEGAKIIESSFNLARSATKRHK